MLNFNEYSIDFDGQAFDVINRHFIEDVAQFVGTLENIELYKAAVDAHLREVKYAMMKEVREQNRVLYQKFMDDVAKEYAVDHYPPKLLDLIFEHISNHSSGFEDTYYQFNDYIPMISAAILFGMEKACT